MTQEHLMGGLSIIVFSGLMLFITISTIKKRFPSTAIHPFNSAAEIMSYYQSSISVLFNQVWILLLPLGFVLFSVKCVIDNEAFVFEKLVNKSLKTYKHLFFLNIILFCVGSIPSLLSLPFTLATFFSLEQGAPSLFSILPHVSTGYSYVYSMFMALTFCVPFALISRELNVIESFKANFIFIKEHLLKYIIFVGVGVLIIFLPSVVHDVFKLFISPFSILSLILEMLFVSLKLMIAVVFYIAMFKFLLDYSSFKAASQLAT